MVEETLFKTEQKMSSAEISEYLKMIADKLEDGETISLEAGDQSVDLNPQGEKEFEVKVEKENSSSNGEINLELEIEWKEGAEESQLEIE